MVGGLQRERNLALNSGQGLMPRNHVARNATPAGVLASNACTRKAAGRLCGLPG
jgi:hypothetical protein